MKSKGITAWLITWEGDVAKTNGRPKAVSVLSPKLGQNNIEFVLRVLFCSEYRLTLCEKVCFGTANRKEMPRYFIVAYSEVNPAFYYGHFPHEYLYARQVKNLQCSENPKNDFECTMTWTELEKFVRNPDFDPNGPLPDDPSKITKMVRGERQESYTYSSR